MNINSVIPLIASVIYLLMLGILIANRPWRRRHRIFAWFLIGALFWSVTNILFRGDFLLDYKLALAKMTIWSFTFMIVPYCYFITTYYDRPRDRWLVLAYVPVVSTAIMAILGYVPESIEIGPSYYPHYNMSLLIIFIALPLLILAGRGLYLLSRGIVLAENPALHNQMIYLLITIAVLGISAISNLTVIGRQLPLSHIGNLIVASLLAYATLKYQLLDIKIVIRGGLVYGAIAVTVALSYILILFIFREWFDSNLGLPAILTVLVMAALIASLFYPLRIALQRGVDHLLFPDTYDYRRTLIDFARKAGSIIKIDELGRELTTLALNAVGARRAYLLLRDSPDSDLQVRFAVPEPDDDDRADLAIRRDSPILDWFRKETDPLLRETLDIRPEFSALWKAEKTAIASAEIEVFAPLISRGNIVGVLALSKKFPIAPYDLSDIELIRLMANEIAIAIENAQLHARIETQAITDGLTHLYNRRHFDARLREEISRESRYGGKFTLALMDLDRFKAYNDTYGHLAGDALLAQIGNSIRNSIRSVDPAFRYGGDEFAILLPLTDLESASIVLERIRRKVADELSTNGVPVTLSIGLACWPDDGVTQGDLIRAADKALYHAKRNGGNSVHLFSQTVSPVPDSREAGRTEDKEALGIIYALAAAVEAKDPHTYGHSRKVSRCSVALAEAIGLSQDDISTLSIASMLHDIGKIGISDGVLGKKAALDSHEWNAIRSHPKTGATIISHVPSLSHCIPAVLYHHERYDGTGYPEGLKGSAIPIHARIMAVADAFAAMTSSRPYREALRHDQVIDELKKGAGTQFDPALVEAFLKIADSIPF